MSTLSRRIAKLETGPHPDARFTVDSWTDHYAVSRRFLRQHRYIRPTAEEAEREARQREDTSLPPEKRMTYAEALAEGVVHETASFRRERAEGDWRSRYIR